MQLSVNPNTQAKYRIPDMLDDAENVRKFLAHNKGKKTVVVQGLGFVGAVMALVCANAVNEDYAVIGIDLPNPESYWKIASLNAGIFPLTAEDPKIEEFYRRAMSKGSFLATHDPYAYSVADVIIVDVNLDVRKDMQAEGKAATYSVDLGAFKRAITSIGERCKENVLLLVETTVPPGTCEKVVHPILRVCLEARGIPTDRFLLGHSYERVMPGPQYVDSIQNFYRVYAGVNEQSAHATESFLRTIISTDKYPLTRLGNTNASEMAKVLENSYRAMNIAFIVEWSRFAEEAGVNLYEVVSAIRMRPTHSNMMLPGIGVGGYCLTKDPLLASWARQNMFAGAGPLTESEASVAINDKMPRFAFEYFRSQYGSSLESKAILLMGVSYLGNVGDTRYTPVEVLFDCLVAAGAEVYLHDPYVRHWEEKGLAVEKSLDTALSIHLDILIVCTLHSQYKDASCIEKLMQLPPVVIFDTLGIFKESQLSKLQTRHKVVVLGRGDI